jgi:lysophospholipase L1-like esterase
MRVRVRAYGSVPAEYLALGDSYTIGEGVEDHERWPLQLAAALRARGVAVTQPHIIARSGWTTDELIEALEYERSQGQLREAYGLVSLQIGVNNQYRDRPLDEFATQFAYLLAAAIRLAGNRPEHVLAASIPDWGVTPYGVASGRDRALIASQVDAFNLAAADECAKRQVAFVDVTGLSRDPALAHALVADGLHPSGEMYARWVERFAAAIDPHDANPAAG